ncbi:MAG: redoxin domain-containing protein [Proteobacteria bacterium]|nr:redoxin domain-containing protein [Pseudomonadota bacterium]
MVNTPAPELTQAVEWINCDPVTLHALRGYVIIIAFWSAGSAYCRNLMDDLRYLQKKYAGALQVIAVHCPKFDAERNPRLVRKTCAQIDAGVRVVHDPDFVTWQHYGVGAWPTAVVVDPDGRTHAVVVGDLHRDQLEGHVTQLVEQGGLALEESLLPALNPIERQMALAFPAGIAVNDNYLYVADSGHHQILECSREGRVLRHIGTGAAEFNDGTIHSAAFRNPRGISLSRDILFVADTGNNALRRVRVVDGDVLTIVGTGRAGQPAGGALDLGRRISLSQPWTVAAGDDRVYVALAGNNQIWMYDRSRNTLSFVAGSGELALTDGDGEAAAFAQPAGLALAQLMLYVVDSGASALRSLQTGTGRVQTLLGQGLFEFGNAAGTRLDTRMQYPLAVAKDPDTANLWVVDSYNNQILKLKLGGSEVSRLEVSAKLECPAAIAAHGGALWIANTHAHEILRVDIASGATRRLPVGE